MNSDHPNLELDANAQRDSLLAMPSHGKVLRVPSRKNPFIDFYPAINGRGRFLYSFTGRGFKDEAEAELVRDRINDRSLEVGIREAVNQFRSLKSKSDLVTDVIEDFLADAPTIGSHAHSGEPYSPRTLDHYRGLLRRAQPYFACMTMREFFAYNELIEFKKWFRKEKRPEGAPPCPGEFGRGLKTDNEMVNCFAPLRVVAKYYERKHPGFSVTWPPNPTKLTIAKRTRKARRSRTGKREPSFTLENVVQAISSINENRQAIYWLLFYTQCRICEARAVLGVDYTFDAELEDDGYERGRIFIERSADSKGAEAEIRNTTKTGAEGGYLMPEFVRRLIAEHCSHARFDPTLPLLRNPHKLAKGDIWTDDALEDTWRSALEKLDLPWVPLYQSMKHTQVSALRKDGVPTDDIVEQCRWTSSEMMSRYDTNRDQRRDVVTARLDSLRRAAMLDEKNI